MGSLIAFEHGSGLRENCAHPRSISLPRSRKKYRFHLQLAVTDRAMIDLDRLKEVLWHRFKLTPLGKALKARKTRLRLARDEVKLGEGGFAEVYVRRVQRKIKRGKAHPTLGGVRWSRKTGEALENWDPQAFAERGKGKFKLFRKHGLAPHMTCVDYGCGSLRLGQHAIRLLPRGSYVGLDVTDYFFRIGLTLLPPEVVDAKQPRVFVISADVLRDLAQEKPDFLFSYAVMQHVPPEDLDIFLGRAIALIGETGRAAIEFVSARSDCHLDGMTWAHEPQGVKARVERLTAKHKTSIVLINEAGVDERGRERSLLLIDGAAWGKGDPKT
jgi:hypothetical protein